MTSSSSGDQTPESDVNCPISIEVNRVRGETQTSHLRVYCSRVISFRNECPNGLVLQYPKPQGNTLNNILVFSTDTAIAVGDLGTVIRTTDGGRNWDVQHHAGGTSIDLHGIHFVDKANGGVGGIEGYEKNVVLKPMMVEQTG